CAASVLRETFAELRRHQRRRGQTQGDRIHTYWSPGAHLPLPQVHPGGIDRNGRLSEPRTDSLLPPVSRRPFAVDASPSSQLVAPHPTIATTTLAAAILQLSPG